MPKRIPIKSAKAFAEEHSCRQVIIFAWDGKTTHCITYGQSIEDADAASLGANEIKDKWCWPSELMTQPSRVTKLQNRIKMLEDILNLSKDTNIQTGKEASKQRKEAKLSRREMASRMGMGLPRIIALEEGKETWTPERILAWHEAITCIKES
jgi:hypothetical protein